MSFDSDSGKYLFSSHKEDLTLSVENVWNEKNPFIFVKREFCERLLESSYFGLI